MEKMISRIQELGLCKIQQTNQLYPYSKQLALKYIRISGELLSPKW
jgi:hypothetical protein